MPLQRNIQKVFSSVNPYYSDAAFDYIFVHKDFCVRVWKACAVCALVDRGWVHDPPPCDDCIQQAAVVTTLMMQQRNYTIDLMLDNNDNCDLSPGAQVCTADAEGVFWQSICDGPNMVLIFPFRCWFQLATVEEDGM